VPTAGLDDVGPGVRIAELAQPLHENPGVIPVETVTLGAVFQLSFHDVEATSWSQNPLHLSQAGIAVGPVVKRRDVDGDGESVVVERDGFGGADPDVGIGDSLRGSFHHRGAGIHASHPSSRSQRLFQGGARSTSDIEEVVLFGQTRILDYGLVALRVSVQECVEPGLQW
jgi:hypothetical protein